MTSADQHVRVSRSAAGGRDVDFQVAGVVGVRLLDPRPADVAVVERQLGPPGPALGRDPDITLQFVDRIDDDRALTYVGWPETGFHADAFYLLRGQHGRTARTLLPFADVGGRCAIVCERRGGPVPHLLAVVNLTALAKGVLALHASAFVVRGKGVLATGWAKGGKTETLLALGASGAQYVGDEWVYLTPDGRMSGVAEPIRLWQWHLRQLPLWGGLPLRRRARLSGLAFAAKSAGRLADRLPAGNSVASVLRRAEPVLRRQAFLQVPPRVLFGEDRVTEARLDTVLLVTNHDRDDVTVEHITGDVVARRMRASLAEERQPFLAHYRQFRFAFPDRVSPTVEQAGELEARLLDRVFSHRDAHHLQHPYPLELDALVAPVESVLARSVLRSVPPTDGRPEEQS